MTNNPRFRSNITLIGQQPGEPGRALKYDQAFCDRVRDFAQRGMWPEEWCAHLGISMTTLYRWANEHPEWEEAIIIGWHLLSAHYARLARENLLNPDLRATVLMEVLRKRFPGIWGRDPKGTQDHFEARNRTADGEKPLLDPSEVRAASDDALREAIGRLEERRRVMREGAEK